MLNWIYHTVRTRISSYRNMRSLKNSIESDNKKIKSLHKNYNDIGFKIVKARNRHILYGVYHDNLYIIKYKINKILIGYPTNLNPFGNHSGIKIDLSNKNDKEEDKDLLGIENYLWYAILPYKETHLSNLLSKAEVRLKEVNITLNKNNRKVKIEDYLKSINSLIDENLI